MNTETTITIAASRLALLNTRIAELAKKAARRSVACPLEVVKIEKVEDRKVRFEGIRVEDTIEMVEVTIEGTVPEMNGYTIVGRLETVASGETIVHKYDTPEAAGVDFEALRARGNYCDHCNSKRRRIDLFVLVKGAEVLTVGRNCLAAYLMDKDEVEQALKSHDLWLESGEWILRLLDKEPPRFGARNSMNVEFYLALVVSLARQMGWRPAREQNCTADLANCWVNSQMDQWAADSGIEMPTQADFDAASAIIGWSQDLQGYGYEANLRAALSVAYCSRKNLRLVASAYAAWARDKAIKAEAEMTADSKYVGEVGTKIDMPMTILGSRYIDSNYGVTTLITFKDSAGNVVKWFASGSKEVKEGTQVRVKATVKRHSEYKGRKETMITRAKLAA